MLSLTAYFKMMSMSMMHNTKTKMVETTIRTLINPLYLVITKKLAILEVST